MKAKRILVAGLAFATAVGTNAMIFSPTFAESDELSIAGSKSYDIEYGDDGTFSITLKVNNPSNKSQTITECFVKDEKKNPFTTTSEAGTIIDGNAQNASTGCVFTLKSADAAREIGSYKGKIGAKYIKDGAKNGHEVKAEFTVNINKKSVAIPTTDSVFTYDGTEKEAEFTPAIDTDLIDVDGNIAATNAGDYDYSLSLKDTDHYQWNDKTTEDKEGSWKIKKANLNLSIIIADWTYGDENNKPTLIGGNSEMGTLTWTYSDDKGEIENDGTLPDAGRYEVCAKVAASQNYNKAKTCTHFHINRREVTITIKGKTGIFTYDGLEKSVGGYTAEISDELYAREGSFSGDEETFKPLTATKVGTYVDDVTAENFTNNTKRNFAVTFEVTPSVLIINEPAVANSTNTIKTASAPIATPETGVFTNVEKTTDGNNTSATVVMAVIAAITVCGIAVAYRARR